jgi:hypothetical protein
MKRTPPPFDETHMRMTDENGNPCKIKATAEEMESAPRDVAYVSTKLGKYALAATFGAYVAAVGAPLSTVFGMAALGYATCALLSTVIRKTEHDHINANVAKKLTGDPNDGAKVPFFKTMASELFDQKKIYSAFKTEPLTDKNGVLRSDLKPF